MGLPPEVAALSSEQTTVREDVADPPSGGWVLGGTLSRPLAGAAEVLAESVGSVIPGPAPVELAPMSHPQVARQKEPLRHLKMRGHMKH
jgi:hypothetical protein